MTAKRPALDRARRKVVVLGSLLLLTVATVMIALAFDVLKFEMRRPNLYDPEREALIEAEWQLSQSIPHGRASPEETGMTHRHIRTVLDWLEKAEATRPQHRRRIIEVRELVAELEAADRAVQASAQHRAQVYDKIIAELETLLATYQPAPVARRNDGE